jgi:hypothetical protein
MSKCRIAFFRFFCITIQGDSPESHRHTVAVAEPVKIELGALVLERENRVARRLDDVPGLSETGKNGSGKPPVSR